MARSAFRLIAALLLLPSLAQAQTPAPVDVDQFIRRDSFERITISPNGDYLAATVPLEDRTGLVVLRRSDKVVTARMTLGKDTHFQSLHWVNERRLLASIAEAFGTRDQPALTGELFGVDFDGQNRRMLTGFRADINSQASRLQTANADSVYATLVDSLPADENYVLIAVTPFIPDAFTRVERMDVRNGKRSLVTRVSAKSADFVTDNATRIRLASGIGKVNQSLLFHRVDDDAEWTMINDELETGRIEQPIGFSPDNRVAYLLSEQAEGPDALVAWDSATGERTEIIRHESHEPDSVHYNLGTGIVPVGLRFDVGPLPEDRFIADSPDARVHRMLAKAFPGQAATITSTTDDGKLALVHVGSAAYPGDFYLFDVVNKKADFLLSQAEWFDPASMGEVRPVTLKSRDGLTLHGVLTLPPGSNGRGLPMVVNPHGGPIGVRDGFGFGREAQMLARAGYAVLQVNFRGSGGYGRAFRMAGARQWGRTMQDDVTDATRWAIEQGIADPRRICIYGASYGAYASLMGVAREPALYRCAVGYVGVYDLDTMVAEDAGQSGFMSTFSQQWVGRKGELAAVSPNNLAADIKVPVFLAAGGEDEIAPVEHTRSMERALAKAGVPVETLYYRNESHGFYTLEHQREYNTRLLDFLARHLGGARAAPTPKGEEKGP